MGTSTTLSRPDAETFFEIRSALAIFTRTSLHAEEASFADMLRRLSTDHWELPILEETWKHPEVFDEFVRADNAPSWFGDREKRIALSWKHHVSGDFIAFKSEGRVLLLCDRYVFEVLGATDPVGYTLGDFPRVVRTTLLPFEDRIVYSGFLLSAHGKPGSREAELMAKQVRVALQGAERVASGARLIELAQPLSEQLAQEESERAFSELESLSSEPAPPAGYHKSAYAGMNEEGLEQIRALRDDLDELASIENLYERCLFPHCVQGVPRFGIADILDAGAPGDISVIARCLGIAPEQGESAGSLGLRVIDLLRSDKKQSDVFLGILVFEQLVGLRKIYEQGGIFTLDLDAPIPIKQLPPLVPLACYAFREGDTVTFVMPDEMRSLFAGLELGRIQALSEFRWCQIRRAEALACLHGVIPVSAVVEVLKEGYPGLRAKAEQEAFIQALFVYANCGALSCYIVQTPGGIYLVDPLLAQYSLYEDGEVVAARRFFYASELPEYLALVREAQLGCEPRPLEEGMEDREGVIRWIERLPALKALRGYLEARVPDGEDDLDFVDRIVSQVVVAAQSNLPTEERGVHLIDVIDDLNEDIAGGTTARRLHEILSNVANSVPLWLRRGWAVRDGDCDEKGRPRFFNEDGSVMKVGPNDACPCGSGQPYKTCCGKEALPDSGQEGCVLR